MVETSEDRFRGRGQVIKENENPDGTRWCQSYVLMTLENKLISPGKTITTGIYLEKFGLIDATYPLI